MSLVNDAFGLLARERAAGEYLLRRKQVIYTPYGRRHKDSFSTLGMGTRVEMAQQLSLISGAMATSIELGHGSSWKSTAPSIERRWSTT